MSRSSISYSQHSQLLEPCKVILMDPSDVVAVELPGGRKERRKMVRCTGWAPGQRLGSRLPLYRAQACHLGQLADTVAVIWGHCFYELCVS